MMRFPEDDDDEDDYATHLQQRSDAGGNDKESIEGDRQSFNSEGEVTIQRKSPVDSEEGEVPEAIQATPVARPLPVRTSKLGQQPQAPPAAGGPLSNGKLQQLLAKAKSEHQLTTTVDNSVATPLLRKKELSEFSKHIHQTFSDSVFDTALETERHRLVVPNEAGDDDESTSRILEQICSDDDDTKNWSIPEGKPFTEVLRHVAQRLAREEMREKILERRLTQDCLLLDIDVDMMLSIFDASSVEKERSNDTEVHHEPTAKPRTVNPLLTINEIPAATNNNTTQSSKVTKTATNDRESASGTTSTSENKKRSLNESDNQSLRKKELVELLSNIEKVPGGAAFDVQHLISREALEREAHETEEDLDYLITIECDEVLSRHLEHAIQDVYENWEAAKPSSVIPPELREESDEIQDEVLTLRRELDSASETLDILQRRYDERKQAFDDDRKAKRATQTLLSIDEMTRSTQQLVRLQEEIARLKINQSAIIKASVAEYRQTFFEAKILENDDTLRGLQEHIARLDAVCVSFGLQDFSSSSNALHRAHTTEKTVRSVILGNEAQAPLETSASRFRPMDSRGSMSPSAILHASSHRGDFSLDE